MTDFWTSTNTNALDPKRNFRFKVNLFQKAIWYARDVTQPVANVSEATHDFMSHRFYFPSKVTWDAVTMTLVDPVTPGSLEELLTTLSNSGYIVPTTSPDAVDAFSSISKPQAVTQLASANNADGSPLIASTTAPGNVSIEVLDAEGGMLHQWDLNNAFITQISPSQLSYTNEELMTVGLTIRYDWASFQSGVPGSAVGGRLFG